MATITKPPVSMLNCKAEPTPGSREEAIITALLKGGFHKDQVTIGIMPEAGAILVCGVHFTALEIEQARDPGGFIVAELIASGVVPDRTPAPPQDDPRATSWIQTRHGKKFNYLDLKRDAVNIRDIAYSLSRTNRFNGHTSRSYSVAEHSVRAALLSLKLYPHSYAFAFEALLHDASEAYIQDIATPAKVLPELAGYRALEKRIQDFLQGVFRLKPGMSPEVKRVDRILLTTEARDLMAPLAETWTFLEPADDEVIRPWSADLAEHRFLKAFSYLGHAFGINVTVDHHATRYPF